MKYRLLITTSGIGSRLGDLTKYTNKSLVRIGKKPALSYIIEAYPEDVEIVVTLGYFGEQVKDFLELAYPERSFKFVRVDKYEGQGSSLVYSILSAKDELQCPFIFHACDTLIFDQKIPEPTNDWLGGYPNPTDGENRNSTHYRTFDVWNESVLGIKDKGESNFDYSYIGVAGINSWKDFWDMAEKVYAQDKNNSQLSDCDVVNEMLNRGMLEKSRFVPVDFNDWLDIGNMDDLKRARNCIPDKFKILDKLEESIFIFDDFVIKFFYDESLVKKRVERSEILYKLTPRMLESRKNFYKYEYVKGDLYSSVVNENNFRLFLNWSKSNLWKKIKSHEESFYMTCYKFYFTKTIDRVNKFFKDNNIEDAPGKINGTLVPAFHTLMDQIDDKSDWLCEADMYNFHGDFILDNIILKKTGGFSLLDWRQDFGGDIECGDIYYDIAKLNHNLVFNHDIVNKNLFKIDINKNSVVCDILRSDTLSKCQEVLFDFFSSDLSFDAKKVRVLTALIWLNMSALHHYPLNMFLFYFGKYNLWRELNV